jgi:hypothetical protein
MNLGDGVREGFLPLQKYQSVDWHPLNLASSCPAVKSMRSPRNRTLMEMAKDMRDSRGCNHVVCSQIFDVVSSFKTSLAWMSTCVGIPTSWLVT